MRLPASCIFLSILLQWLILLPMSRAMLNGFTTVVEAGKVNCFYENISDNKTLEIEYQVRQDCVFSDFNRDSRSSSYILILTTRLYLLSVCCTNQRRLWRIVPLNETVRLQINTYNCLFPCYSLTPEVSFILATYVALILTCSC